MYKHIFGSIELVGALTIACVWLGVIAFRALGFDTSFGLIMLGMLLFATLVMLITIGRRLWVWYPLITVLGVTLLLLGGMVALCMPEYFFSAYALQAPYWLRVSVYSLPAICIEGGIFTLYIAFVEKGALFRTAREKLFMAIGFLLYAITTVTANFMTINGSIAVHDHIQFARIVTLVVLILTIVVVSMSNKQSRSFRRN